MWAFKNKKEVKFIMIQVYDPAMCCSTGLCGPNIDPVLIKMNDAIITLQKQGVHVERFNLAQQPKAFMDNPKVKDLLISKGKDILPITIVNGEIFKTGEYPSYEELCKALGLEPITNKKITLNII